MGKKKPQKTKELAVAIAEASSTGDETQQQQLTPRKRGRPRKIVEKTGSEENKEQPAATQTQEAEEVDENRSKRIKTCDEEEQKEEKHEEPTAPVRGTKKGEGQSVVERELPPRRSRARRKSKPRKSS